MHDYNFTIANIKRKHLISDRLSFMVNFNKPLYLCVQYTGISSDIHVLNKHKCNILVYNI